MSDCPADESYACEALTARTKLEDDLAKKLEEYADDAASFVRLCLRQQAFPAHVDEADKQSMIPKPIRDRAGEWADLCAAIRQARLEAMDRRARVAEEERLVAAGAVGAKTLDAFDKDMTTIGAALFLAKPVFENWLATLPTATAKAKHLHDMQVLSVEDWLTLANASPEVAEREEALQRSLWLCKRVQSPIWSRVVRRLVAAGQAVTVQSVSAALDEATMSIMSSTSPATNGASQASAAAASASRARGESATAVQASPVFEAARLLAPRTASAAAGGEADASSSAAAGSDDDHALLRELISSGSFVGESASSAASAASDEPGPSVRVMIGDHRRKLAPTQLAIEAFLLGSDSAPRRLLGGTDGAVVVTGIQPGADSAMACSLINSRIAEAAAGAWPAELPTRLKTMRVAQSRLGDKQFMVWRIPRLSTEPKLPTARDAGVGEPPIQDETEGPILSCLLSLSMSIEDIVNCTSPLASTLTGELTVQGNVGKPVRDFATRASASLQAEGQKFAAKIWRMAVMALEYVAAGASVVVKLPPAAGLTGAIKAVLETTGHDRAAEAGFAHSFAPGPFHGLAVATLAKKANSIDSVLGPCILRTVATVESVHFVDGNFTTRVTGKGLTVPFVVQAGQAVMEQALTRGAVHGSSSSAEQAPAATAASEPPASGKAKRSRTKRE